MVLWEVRFVRKPRNPEQLPPLPQRAAGCGGPRAHVYGSGRPGANKRNGGSAKLPELDVGPFFFSLYESLLFSFRDRRGVSSIVSATHWAFEFSWGAGHTHLYG